ncbi:MAG: type II toxin-antitoxin system RelE/ParE family toxin [Verrucomicrobia bacterium]|nr:type II toxin-antitoxin system RelE/ParE family toxin [Verrucomicrobiota bacterium]
MKRLTYLLIAETELTEAACFYDERQPGLGRRFLDAVREGKEQVRHHPDRWAFYEEPVRSYRLQTFPYRLLYRELPDRIQIVAVMHLSRHPDYWKDRLA